MRVLNQLILSVAIATTLISCSANRIPQCNRLITANQETEQITADYAQNPQPQQGGNRMVEIADRIDAATVKLETVKLQDKKLKAWQSRLVTNHRDMTKALRGGATALDQKDIFSMHQTGEVLKIISDREQTIVDELNEYCS
jgi:hypothetical protein